MTGGFDLPHPRLIILSLIISLTVLAFHLGSEGLLPTAHADSRGLTLYGNSNGWNYSRTQVTNPSLEANFGDTISITLISDDQKAHLFVLDVDNNGPSLDCPGPDKCAEVFGQGQSVTLTFTANFTTSTCTGQSSTYNKCGTYEYYDYFYPKAAYGYFTIWGPDFTINSDSGTLAFANGSSTSTPIEVSSYGKFSGTVSLSVVANPSGLAASLEPSVFVLKNQQSEFPTLTVAGSVPGTFIVTLTATNGTASRYGVFTVIVTDGPDFVLTSLPSSQWAYAAADSSTGIRVTSTGFQGVVLLSTAVSPSGPDATLSLASTTSYQPAAQTITRYVKAGSWNYTTLNFNSGIAPAADYGVNVTGIGGGRTHSAFIPFKVFDFALSTTTRVLGPIGLGMSAMSSIKVTALNGFTDSLNFSISFPFSSSGLSASLGSMGVMGSGTFNVTIKATSISPGTYPVMITAYHYASLAHTLMLEVTVAYGLPAYVLPGVISGAAASVGAAVYLLRRRTHKPSEP